MTALIIILALLVLVVLAVLITSYICTRLTFSVDRERAADPTTTLDGEQYDDVHDIIFGNINEALKIEFEPIELVAADGKRLFGRYYHSQDNAPIKIMFHGYRGNGVKDMAGGLQYTLAKGYNVIAVDQRAHGRSEGRLLSFGALERFDVLDWIGYVNNRFGSDTPIILAGISMGASTVLLASGLDLPENVKAVIADCGYSSAKEIIIKVMREMNFPPRLLYPFVRLGGKIFGSFDINEADCEKALQKSKTPTLFIHGNDDRFVPFEMGKRNYSACNAEKEFVEFDKVGHGLAFIVDKEKYIMAEEKFLKTYVK